MVAPDPSVRDDVPAYGGGGKREPRKGAASLGTVFVEAHLADQAKDDASARARRAARAKVLAELAVLAALVAILAFAILR
jgi:hypothetical protein